MKFFIIFASIVASAVAGKLAHDYKFEVKHEHYPVKHQEGESYAASGSWTEGEEGVWTGGDDYKGDYHHHPAYKYEYGVHDPHTKDHKSQWETRDGDVVKGEYTLDEADGTKRVVKYSSDKHNGFQAHVERIGHAEHGHHY